MKRFIVGAVAALALSACGGGGQSETCKKYLACTEAVSAGSSASLKSSYGEGGTCWTTNQASADACTTACQSALDTLKAANPNQAECK